MTLLSVLLPTAVFGAPFPVSMESFKQGWTDREATLSLKNNTDEEIRSIKFIIEYFDMNDKALDYEIFTRKVNIAPGMTRSIDIPAYENRRLFAYYQSETYDKKKAFKVSYKLMTYNNKPVYTDDTGEAELDSSADNDESDKAQSSSDWNFRGWEFLIILIFLFLMLGGYIGLYALVLVMAKRRRRNPVGWVLVAILATPLLAILLLLIAGQSLPGEN